MKHIFILLLLFQNNVEFTLAHDECLELPSVEHAFVPNEYKKAAYQNGDVIYFSCAPGYTTGLNTTYVCTEHGWRAATIGQCTEMSCLKPPLDNFEVKGDELLYKIDEVLPYSCNRGYKKVNRRPSLCTNVGQSAQWTPLPQCELITCKVYPNSRKDTIYSPQNQTIFKPGQTLNVSCGDKKWVKNKELQSAELTCQDTGRWDFEPMCRFVTCRKIAVNVHQWQRVQDDSFNINQTLWYQCNELYEETSPTSRARCTRGGWEPNPLCKERRCTKPWYRNAHITDHYQKDKYEHDERVHFRCTYNSTVTFYVDCQYGEWRGSTQKCKEKPCTKQPHVENGEMVDSEKGQYDHGVSVEFRCSEERDTFSVTCLDGVWTKQKSCKVIPCKLSSDPPEGTTYSPQNQTIFNPGQTVTVSCGEKQWVKSKELQSAELTCQETGDWDYEPVCQMVTCSRDDENVYNWEQNWYERNIVYMDQTLWYSCYQLYEVASPTGRAKCTRGGWEPNPLCKENGCTKPSYKNAVIRPDQSQKDKYEHNERVHFRCTYYHTVAFYVFCSYGFWRGATQTCPAHANCGPVPEIPHLIVKYKILRYRHGETFPIQCETGHQNLHLNLTELTCTEGNWTSKDVPFKQICTPIGNKCNPPPEMKNAVIMAPFETEYSSGIRLTYKCRDNYTMEGDGTVWCNNGTWERKDFSAFCVVSIQNGTLDF